MSLNSELQNSCYYQLVVFQHFCEITFLIGLIKYNFSKLLRFKSFKNLCLINRKNTNFRALNNPVNNLLTVVEIAHFSNIVLLDIGLLNINHGHYS